MKSGFHTESFNLPENISAYYITSGYSCFVCFFPNMYFDIKFIITKPKFFDKGLEKQLLEHEPE